MMFDPLREARIRSFDQERKRREEKGVYKGPNLIWVGTLSFLLVLALIIIAFLVHGGLFH
jgi:hypothetical protein